MCRARYHGIRTDGSADWENAKQQQRGGGGFVVNNYRLLLRSGLDYDNLRLRPWTTTGHWQSQFIVFFVYRSLSDYCWRRLMVRPRSLSLKSCRYYYSHSHCHATLVRLDLMLKRHLYPQLIFKFSFSIKIQNATFSIFHALLLFKNFKKLNFFLFLRFLFFLIFMIISVFSNPWMFFFIS